MTVALNFNDEHRKLLLEQLKAACQKQKELHHEWAVLNEERVLFCCSRLRKRNVGNRVEITKWMYANFRVFRQRAEDLREKMAATQQEIKVILDALRNL